MQDKPTNCCTTGKNCYIEPLYLLSFIPPNDMIYALSSAKIVRKVNNIWLTNIRLREEGVW